jgi:allophanate hydrolase subunit 1
MPDTEINAPVKHPIFEAAKASSSYLFPYVLALAAVLYAVREVQVNRYETMASYRTLTAKFDVALTRQEESLARLRKIEENAALNRQHLERLIERFAPKPE